MTRPSYRAAVVQRGTDVVTRNGRAIEDMAANRDGVIRWIQMLIEGSDDPPRLIVFPVLAFSGASGRRVEFNRHDVEMEFPSLFLRPVIEACQKYDCYVVTTCVEKHPAFPGHTFHTGFVLGPDGLVLRQPKVQARSSPSITVLKTFRGEYANKLGEAAVHAVADTPIGRIGCIVEAEQYVPEVVRALATRGAEIIVHPNLERGNRRPYLAIKQARAFENGVYVLSANAAYEKLDDDLGIEYVHGRGDSAIVGPDGLVLARCDYSGEGFATATIDLSVLDAARVRQRGDTEPDYALFAPIYGDPEPPKAS